jgi:hypothetical protein
VGVELATLEDAVSGASTWGYAVERLLKAAETGKKVEKLPREDLAPR